MLPGHSQKPRAQPSMIALGCLLALAGIGIVAWEMSMVQPLTTSPVSDHDLSLSEKGSDPWEGTPETRETQYARSVFPESGDHIEVELPESPVTEETQPILSASDFAPPSSNDWFAAPITDPVKPVTFAVIDQGDRQHQSSWDTPSSGVHDPWGWWTIQPASFDAESAPSDSEDAEERPRPSASSASEPHRASESEAAAPEQLGVPPPRPQPQFLRDQSVLLAPGEYQFELGFSYNHNVTQTPISIDLEDSSVVTQLRTVTTTFLTPLEFRLGVQPGLQAFISAPFGYSKQQLVVATLANTEEEWGIGDVGFGLTKVLREPQADKPTLLGLFGVTAPTGKANIPATQQLPGVVLGSGFWTISTGLVAIRSFDPVVTFASLNFTYTFDASIGDLSLSPGNIVSYRFGVGYAVNSRVTLSTAFTGAHIGGIRLDDRYLSGTAREPFSLRLAATIVDRERSMTGHSSVSKRATEPFVNLGLSQAAPEVIFGIRWTF